MFVIYISYKNFSFVSNFVGVEVFLKDGIIDLKRIYHLDIWVKKFIKHNRFYFYKEITGFLLIRVGDKIDNLLYIQSILLFIRNLGYNYG